MDTLNKSDSSKRLFHYSRASRLIKILNDKAIKPTNILIDDKEIPAVWFSFRQDYEPTAIPGLSNDDGREQLSFSEFSKIESPARIEINPTFAPMPWRVWRKLSGVKSKTARALEESAMRLNANVADWRMSFEPVTLESGAWIKIEIYFKDGWREVYQEDVFKSYDEHNK